MLIWAIDMLSRLCHWVCCIIMLDLQYQKLHLFMLPHVEIRSYTFDYDVTLIPQFWNNTEPLRHWTPIYHFTIYRSMPGSRWGTYIAISLRNHHADSATFLNGCKEIHFELQHSPIWDPYYTSGMDLRLALLANCTKSKSAQTWLSFVLNTYIKKHGGSSRVTSSPYVTQTLIIKHRFPASTNPDCSWAHHGG